jgi:serine/threonine protein phosphatase PrpC
MRPAGKTRWLIVFAAVACLLFAITAMASTASNPPDRRRATMSDTTPTAPTATSNPSSDTSPPSPPAENPVIQIVPSIEFVAPPFIPVPDNVIPADVAAANAPGDLEKLAPLGMAFGGIFGAVLVARAGVAMRTALRRKSEVTTETPLLADTVAVQPDESAEPPKPVAVMPHPARFGAADVAYIDQKEWMASLSRQYGDVITRPSPLRAAVSIAGPRDGNEDYAAMFRIEGQGLDCLLVADGCGGHPGGQYASCLAVRAASEAIIIRSELPPTKRLCTAFEAASHVLSNAGQYWDENSLRTTLIVVIATQSSYYVGHIGDGGVVLHRQNGRWESLIRPHQEVDDQSRITASLGPKQEGVPSFSSHCRHAGDRLYAGTDGIFDVYSEPAAFWEWFEQNSNSVPQTALTQFLLKCGGDDRFHDNMTVCYLATPLCQTAAAANLASRRLRAAYAGQNNFALSHK